ncbi:hypothetical protein ACEPAI_8332 [Sanghuangporus weigelae]
MITEFRSRLKNISKLSTWELKSEPSAFAPSSSLSYGDMDPVPSQQQTWATMNFVLYRISDANNIAVWKLASSILPIGLKGSAPTNYFASNYPLSRMKFGTCLRISVTLWV